MIEEYVKQCTGCGVCTTICPKQCLSLKENKDGFYKASLTSPDKCIKCGLCVKSCAQIQTVDFNKVISAESFVYNEIKELKTMSSGGLCYALCRNYLQESKQVVACIYNYDNNKAEHVLINTIDGLQKTKGSKYIQSYTYDGFSRIYDGKEYIIVGTPCQIASISLVAKQKGVRDKLFLVDFFCHGTPSLNLWKKYIEEISKEGEVEHIDFRSKHYGWHNFSFRIHYKNGSIKDDYNDNMFYNFFFSNLCLNECCYSCRYKGLNSCADLRVGDYWGEKYKDNQNGVSCCVVFSKKGNAELQKNRKYGGVKEENIDDILKAQMADSPGIPKERKRVLCSLTTRKSLRYIRNTDLFLYRIKYLIRRIQGER